MTIQELFDFLSDQIEIDFSELTEYMENENIQPKTKMSNIQRYEQEDCQKIYDYFVANKPKKGSKKKPPVNAKTKSDPQEKTLENREYTIPEIAALLNENKTKFYRFTTQHKIKPAAIKNKTKYFSYADTLRIIDHFTDLETFNVTTEPESEPASELAAPTGDLNNSEPEEPVNDLNAVTSSEERVTASEPTAAASELQDEPTTEPMDENVVTIGELQGEPEEPAHETTTIIQEEPPIEPKEIKSVTTSETSVKNNSFTTESKTENQEIISDLDRKTESIILDETSSVQQQPAAVTEDVSHEERQPLFDQMYQNQQTEITYLKRENELLRSELDQKNRQLAELTQRLEQAQYLHSKTQNISEKQQPFFKMPEIIEADKIETTEANEPQKRSLLGLFKKNN